MDIVSSSVLVTRSDGERVTHSPGTPVTVTDDEARDLFARGIAKPADGKLPDFSETEQESEGTGEQMEEAKGDTIDDESDESGESSAINLNTATAAKLTSIKGVGKKTAADIVASRKADGDFKSLADCAERVGGVSVEQLEAADVIV